jgi:hypothetical protein
MKRWFPSAGLPRETRWRLLAGLSALASLELGSVGLRAVGVRLLLPVPLPAGGLRLAVASADNHPLESHRAARISVLATSPPHLTASSGRITLPPC